MTSVSLKKILANILTSGVTPVGIIEIFAGSTAPPGWLICDGTAVSRDTYSALFNVIGTTYGAGDGSTTFNLPNLQGRVPIGVSSGHALGTTGGAETVTLDTTMIPAHTHGSKSLSGAFSVRKYGNDYNMVPSTSGIITSADTTGQGYATNTTSTQYALQRVEVNATHEHTSVGGGQAHDNMQPFITINYIISVGV